MNIEINTQWKVSIFVVFLVRNFPHSDWIRRETPYTSVFSPNVENMDQKDSGYGHFSRSETEIYLLSYWQFKWKISNTTEKKWIFPLRICLVNVNKSIETADFFTFTVEMCHKKRSFLSNLALLWNLCFYSSDAVCDIIL